MTPTVDAIVKSLQDNLDDWKFLSWHAFHTPTGIVIHAGLVFTIEITEPFHVEFKWRERRIIFKAICDARRRKAQKLLDA
jgi:hypothetical protein